MTLYSLPKSTLLIVIIACAICLHSCSNKFDIGISVDESENILFSLKKSSLFSIFESSVSLNNFGIYRQAENGEWDYRNPIWRFGISPGSYKNVKSIKYGVVPAGFEELRKGDKLQFDTPYLAGGSGAGCTGNVMFKIIKTNGKTSIIILENTKGQ